MNFWKVLSDIVNIAREIDREHPRQLDGLSQYAQKLKDVLTEKAKKINEQGKK